MAPSAGETEGDGNGISAVPPLPDQFDEELEDRAEGTAAAGESPHPEDWPWAEDGNGNAAEAGVQAGEGPPRWLRELRRAARASALRPGQASTFLAAVELDEARPRERRLGWKSLFIEYCAHGQAHWLDPARAMAHLAEILERFHGETARLRFIMLELLKLARSGLSPDAFLRHVVLPRMAGDMDWRRWRLRHGEALSDLSDMLARMRREPPFDSQRLGDTGVVTDIALCKYAGRPLARLGREQWASLAPERSAYEEAWKRFSFRSRPYLLFLRRNVFPLLYGLSGLIDPQQLVPILEAAADLEAPFARRIGALPPRLAELALESSDLHSDLGAFLASRREQGQSWISFARSLRDYLRVARALLSANAGLTLLGWAARFLRSARDESLAGDLAEMIPRLRDSGGVAALTWHARRLRSLPPAARAAFIEGIERAGGLDLAYPYRGILIPQEDEGDLRAEAAVRLARSLDLPGPPEGAERGYSIKAAFREFMESSEERRAAAEAFFQGALAGAERDWSDADLAFMDAPGPAGHELMMRRLIPGLGSGFSLFGLKSPDLTGLRRLYRQADSLSLLAARFDFSLREGRDSSESRLDALSRDELRKRINMDLISRAARAAAEARAGDDPELQRQSEAFAALASLQRDARKGLDSLSQRLARADSEAAREGVGEAEREAARRRAAKLKAQAASARARLELMDRVFALREDPATVPEARFALCAHLAAFAGKPLDEACAPVLGWAVARWAGPEARRRIAFLKEDMSPGFVTLEQLSLLIGALDSVCRAMIADRRLEEAMASADPALRGLLAETSPLAGRGVGPESLDAALRRCAGLPRLEAERVKWKEFVDRLSRDERQERHYAVRSSKCFLDAYYGDMGGTCLSSLPDAVLRPGLLTLRLLDMDEGQIIGSALAAYVAGRPRSFGAGRYWLAFAFNPLHSAATRWNSRQLLMVYLAFRRVLERLCAESGMPVLIAGTSTNGIVSNNMTLQNLILNYELSGGARPVRDAGGFSLLYHEAAYARACLAIDPDNPLSFRSERDLPRLLAAEAAVPTVARDALEADAGGR